VQRSRVRSIEQSRQIVSAARRLITERGDQWTTQDLAREAGVAVQTFYRYFGGKDQLLLAVIEDLITESVEEYARAARKLKDPLARLRSHVTVVFSSFDHSNLAAERFITAQHWRLHQLYPRELEEAVSPYTNLVADGIRSAEAAGLLVVGDADWAAQFVARLVMVEHHYYAFAEAEASMAEIAERIWQFCLTGLGVTKAVGTLPEPTTQRSSRARAASGRA
jgi:AcrR family transcriptional regulator